MSTIKTSTFTDRELQILRVSLELLRQTKQEQITSESETPPLNEFDLLEPRHTLMHTLTALSKITGLPVQYFQNPNPSQTPDAQNPTSSSSTESASSSSA
jgi:hypothetical protein